MNAPAELVRQHLIDPEICIRCNTCEETCPVNAITHDSRNYVVDPAKWLGDVTGVTPQDGAKELVEELNECLAGG